MSGKVCVRPAKPKPPENCRRRLTAQLRVLCKRHRARVFRRLTGLRQGLCRLLHALLPAPLMARRQALCKRPRVLSQPVVLLPLLPRLRAPVYGR